MNSLLGKLSITVSDHVYVKDPESSALGRRIITGGIDLIDEIGLEQLTFRKLGRRVGTTEASIYRYFENKHKLLLYLVIWYWGWMEYRLVFRLANVEDPTERLRRAIRVLTEQVREDGSFSHINEVRLNRIVVAESVKAYLTRRVDDENAEGAFAYYKQLVDRVSTIILEIEPDFPYPHMLVSTIIEGAHRQRYFAAHLPRLTNTYEGEDSIVTFFTDLAFRAIR
jgi:AcrR family transcriptional regulator